MLRDIVEYYSSTEFNGRKRPFYRFIGMEEFENIFVDEKLLFTNPLSWHEQGSDPWEVHFENIEVDKEHLRKVWKHIRESEEAKYKRLGIDCITDCNSIFLCYVASAAVLQQKAFVYCVADNIRNKKIIDEYRKKCARNIIIEFAPDFYAKLSMMQGNGVLCGEYLYVDFMPMVYVNNMDEYIDTHLHNGVTLQQIAEAYFDRGET